MARAGMVMGTVLLVGLAGCANEPAAVAAAEQQDCVSRTSPTGTMIIRREACVPVSDEARAEARRRAEEMQAQQERSRRTAPGGAGR